MSRRQAHTTIGISDQNLFCDQHHLRRRYGRFGPMQAGRALIKTRVRDSDRTFRSPPGRDSLAERKGFEPSVSLARVSLDSRGGGGRRSTIRVVSKDAVPFPGGTSGSNPSSSSRESGEIVGSATLAGRGRCFTAPRLFIWGLSISRAPLQAWAGNVLATSLSESGLGDDMAR